MKLIPRLVLIATAATLLSGCTYLNSLTGQTNNTVLPGQREDAIPGRASFPDKQDVTVGSTSTPTDSAASGAEPYCAPDDKSCKPPATTGDTFKDPQ
ncbi:hypothetical protein [Aestuariivirga sp.]|uniref:hypothetical protein n=1 Tax=Aestuariivirga sp. TaxID=2650926 RepID=UPI003BAB902E